MKRGGGGLYKHSSSLTSLSEGRKSFAKNNRYVSGEGEGPLNIEGSQRTITVSNTSDFDKEGLFLRGFLSLAGKGLKEKNWKTR